jgi:hypothetical protein
MYMFVVERSDEFRLVTQPDHANLSGQVALHWGNETFETPDPHHSMIIAGEDHDHGWKKYDLTPHIDDTGKPIGFREAMGDEWTTFYGSGVENTMDVDLYSGLMVSLHAAGLRRQGYGVRPEIPDMHNDPEYASFVEEQEQFQEEIMAHLQDNDRFASYATETERAFLNEIHETGDYSGRCRTWYNYLLLQVFDLLSIYFCDNYTLEETTIGPVPVTYGSEETELTITPIDDTEVRIDPYPFDTSPLPFSTTGRYVSNTFETQEELTELYYKSERETFSCTVRE